MSTVFGQLRYGGSSWQRIDLYAPDEPPVGMPGVVLVHGGFWRHERTAQDLEPLAFALAGLGHRVAVVEYRPSWDGGAWPHAADDCRDALRALVTQRDDWADAVLVGHSAGAHLLLSAVAGTGAAAGLLLLAPVAEPERAAELGIGQGAVGEFLAAHLASGGGIGDAVPGLVPGDVRAATVIVAACDQAVPEELSDHQVRWLASRGVPLRTVRVADARHMHLVKPDRPAHSTVLRELAALASRALEGRTTA